MDNNNNVGSTLKKWAETTPDKEVFVFFNEHGKRNFALTANDVYQQSGRFATKLKNVGFQFGDVISNAIPNSPERIVTDFGIIMAGCVSSNCQIVSKDGSEFWNILPYYKSVGLVLPIQESNETYALLKQFLPSELPSSGVVDVSIPQGPTINHIICVGRGNNDNEDISFLDDLRQSSDEIFIHPDLSSQTLGYIFATSGTTGLGKPSPRTHEILLAAARIENMPPDIRFCQRPTGYVGGFPYMFLGNCSTTIIQDRFEGKNTVGPQQLWDVLENEECVAGFMVPEELQELVDHFKDNPPKFKLGSLFLGGQPMTKQRICGALGVLSSVMGITYASTEMSAVTVGIITKPEDMEDYFCGYPCPGVSLRIVNDEMEDVEPGESGILLVKCTHGSNTYHNFKPEYPTTTDDGYFITRDRAWRDKQGRLFVSDRNDEAIQRGSFMVYPSWPQGILEKIPEVSEAVVFGIAQGDGAKKLLACVVLHSGFSLTKGDLMSAYDDYFTIARDEFFPKLDYLHIFSSLPKLHSGKVNKIKLREMAMDMIQLNE